MTRKQPDDDEIEEHELPDDVGDWPTRAQAAKTLNVSVATIIRWAKAKKLNPVLHKGVWRFSADELESLSSDDGSPEAVSAEISRIALEHSERMFQLLEEPSRLQLVMLQELAERQQKRITELEGKLTEAHDMVEKAREKGHERELEILRWNAQDDRKNALLNFVIEQGPRLTQQFVANGQGPELLGSLSSLAKSLNSEQVGSLMGILDETQQTTLGKILEITRQEDTVNTECQETKTHKLLEE